MVPQSAGISIVTTSAVGLENAASRFVAEIIGTGIRIVAIHLGTKADSLLTMIGNGTGIAIFAFIAFQGEIAAARLTIADILGAVVVIITKINEVAADVVGFIHTAIAIIVKAVARFCRRHRGIALGETGFGANSFAQAGARLLGHLARRPQSESHRR